MWVIKEGFIEESGVELVFKSWRKRIDLSRDNINKDTDTEIVVWTSPLAVDREIN